MVEQMLIEWTPRVYAIVRNARWVDRNEVDDIAQELLTRLWLVLSNDKFDPSHRSGATLRTYLYTCLRREMFNQRRKREGRRERKTPLPATFSLAGDYAEPIDTRHNRALACVDAFEAAADMLCRLPTDQAEAFTLAAIGYDMTAIGQMIGVTAPTVAKRIQLAVERLHGSIDNVPDGALRGSTFDHIKYIKSRAAPRIVRQHASVKMWMENRRKLRKRIRAIWAAKEGVNPATEGPARQQTA